MGFLLGLPWHLGYVGGIQDLLLVTLLSLNRIGFRIYPKTTLTSLTVNQQRMEHDPIFRVQVVTSPTQTWNAQKTIFEEACIIWRAFQRFLCGRNPKQQSSVLAGVSS